MAKHPHYEVMMEWAADTSKVVQYRRHSSSEWEDERGAPDFNGFGEYRIKPMPKPNVTFSVKIVQKNAFPQCVWPEHWEMANCDLVFDGETGKLIKAEVLHAE